MIAQLLPRWLTIPLLIACYLVICVRMALRMAATGRSFWKWLLITCFATAIPAIIVLWVRPHPRDDPRGEGPDGDEDEARAPRRCPHCGKVIVTGAETIRGVAECPHCGMVLEGDGLG